jgi:putative ABC transport system permease protein
MLMIGVTVVTLFTVLGASINKAVEEQVNEAFVGDLVVSSGGGGFGGFDAGLTQRLREVPQVEQVTPLRFGPASIDGEGAQAAVVDPATLGSGLKLSVVEGNLADLSGETIAVSKQQAEDENLRLGDRLPITFLDGQSVDLPISAIFEAQGVLNGVNFALSTNTFDPHATDKLDSSVFVSFKDDVSTADGREAIKPITDDYSQATVQDRKEFRESVQSQINTFLALIYVLLALSIFISLLGIANTLSLSIHERTRELGLLRAVGMSRKQLRSAVRWESIILAVFGTIGGLALGVFISWAFVKPAERENFASLTLPTGSLAIILFVGALAGLVAAISPARRAAKLNVLDAIATE